MKPWKMILARQKENISSLSFHVKNIMLQDTLYKNRFIYAKNVYANLRSICF